MDAAGNSPGAAAFPFLAMAGIPPAAKGDGQARQRLLATPSVTPDLRSPVVMRAQLDSARLVPERPRACSQPSPAVDGR